MPNSSSATTAPTTTGAVEQQIGPRNSGSSLNAQRSGRAVPPQIGHGDGAQEDVQAQRHHQDHDDRPPGQAAQRHALDAHAHEEHGHHGQRDGQPTSAGPLAAGGQHHVGAQHHQRTLRQVGHRAGLVDQHDAHGHQRVHQPGHAAVDGQFERSSIQSIAQTSRWSAALDDTDLAGS
jgi:hypothetical protein